MAHPISLQTLETREVFRADLFHRLNVVPFDVPVLRERREDMPFLVTPFLHHDTTMHHRQVERVSTATLEMLCQDAWPGNVRELSSILERLVVLNTQKIIDVEAIHAAPKESDCTFFCALWPLGGVENAHWHIDEKDNSTL